MKRLSFVMAIFIIHFCDCTIAQGQRLWVDEVNIKSDNGKDLIMKFEEIERKDEYSIARVTHTYGASVASVMFVSKGFYNIAKQRGKKYYINLKEWRDAR